MKLRYLLLTIFSLSYFSLISAEEIIVNYSYDGSHNSDFSDINVSLKIGDVMDAEIHDAMITQTDESMEDHVILSVFEKGYSYRDKVIRHAKVIVNKK